MDKQLKELIISAQITALNDVLLDTLKRKKKLQEKLKKLNEKT